MNFFDQQQDARRATRLLAWLFLLALALLVLLVNLGIFCLWWFYTLREQPFAGGTELLLEYARSPVCLTVSLATLVVFAGGSVRRSAQLRKNSTALAQLVNATEITLTTAASDEKQLINVVEEMAVAAGIPPPRLFVMRNESAINAFVTGVPPQQLLVVTQGALDGLTRDELQGVIGHEFSHLLNGDTRLNLRMLVILAGLFSVGRLGLYLITLGWPERQLKSRMEFQQRIGGDISGGDKGNGLFILAGCVLVVAGYAGLFIGRLIKAAISRQREALADASAQQFTRNPAGLAGALVKIKNGPGTLLTHPFAEDINHMCFGDSVRIHWRRLLATHPDIDTRLKQIDPSWIARARARQRQQENTASPTGKLPDTRQLGYAQSLIAGIPPTLSQALHDTNGACLVIYALLMDVSQQKFLPAVAPVDKQKLPELAQQINQLGSRTRLPLIDLALPALQRLDATQLKQLLDNIDWLIKADGQVSLFEYLLRQLVRHRLLPEQETRISYTRLEPLANSMQLLLSMLIHHACRDDAGRQALFRRFAAPLLPPGRQLLAVERCSLKALAQAMQQVRQLSPLLKKSLLDTCADIILVDGKVQVEEMELLRLVCLLADCPMPPLVAG
jgi:Zn-dependent protease with chaperone function